jgi:hypothetical protein
MNPFTESITLNGSHAMLEPLSQDHHDGRVEAVGDGDLWKLWYTSVPSPEDMRTEIERRLSLQHAGCQSCNAHDRCDGTKYFSLN